MTFGEIGKRIDLAEILSSSPQHGKIMIQGKRRPWQGVCRQTRGRVRGGSNPGDHEVAGAVRAFGLGAARVLRQVPGTVQPCAALSLSARLPAGRAAGTWGRPERRGQPAGFRRGGGGPGWGGDGGPGGG